MRRASLALAVATAVMTGWPERRSAIGRFGREDHPERRDNRRHGLVQPVQGMLHVGIRDDAPNYNMLYGSSGKDLSPVAELTSGCEPSTDYVTWTCPSATT